MDVGSDKKCMELALGESKKAHNLSFFGGRRRVPVSKEELASQEKRNLLYGGLAEL